MTVIDYQQSVEVNDQVGFQAIIDYCSKPVTQIDNNVNQSTDDSLDKQIEQVLATFNSESNNINIVSQIPDLSQGDISEIPKQNTSQPDDNLNEIYQASSGEIQSLFNFHQELQVPEINNNYTTTISNETVSSSMNNNWNFFQSEPQQNYYNDTVSSSDMVPRTITIESNSSLNNFSEEQLAQVYDLFNLLKPAVQDNTINSTPVEKISKTKTKKYKVTKASNNVNLSIQPRIPKGSKNSSQKIKFDYKNINIPYEILYQENLRNVARSSIDDQTERDNIRNLKDGLLNQNVCKINRTKFTRHTMEQLENLVISLTYDVKYEKNTKYATEDPYQQEFTRVQIDPSNNLPLNSTRCGLCAYCPDIKFFNIKDSSYSQHLACNHGIFTNNYIAPDPYNYANYYVKKHDGIKDRKTTAKERLRKAVICPACHDRVEVNCSISTRGERPLINYLRHFKDKHRQSKLRESHDKIGYFEEFQ